MKFETLKDIENLRGEYESNILEFKREIPKSDRLHNHIHGFLNGDSSVGHIIIGIGEKDGEADVENLYPVQFPIQMNEGKQEIKNFDDYKLHLQDSFRSYLPKYTEGMFNIDYIEKTIIVITINQSPERPLFNKSDEAYIRRNANTTKMSSHEFEKAIEERVERQRAEGQKKSNIENQKSELTRYREWIESDEVIATSKDGKHAYRFLKAPYAFLYLKLKHAQKIEFAEAELNSISREKLHKIFGRDVDGISYPRNKYGTVLYDPNHAADTIDQFTQVFLTGSIMGVESLRHKNEDGTKGVIPAIGIEKIFKEALESYLNFLNSILKNNSQFKLTAGLVNISGSRLGLPANHLDRLSENIHKDEVLHQVTIDNNCDFNKELTPFFEKIWDSVGLTRP